ncbi:ABC transporter permease [Nocardia sp. 2]|uniref:Transport permease protein n=1 Tax=Nocardia acididurans TaxID=2802282 RepID=A0ABS1M6I4_9NOCA|nr:ABC transporter permease [Nocardia acididurans]MBL1076263.1 ABC transporter permease [Nocardia acididurans]
MTAAASAPSYTGTPIPLSDTPSRLRRLRWAVADACTVAGRDLAHWRRRPGAVIANTLLFPIMIVLMFGYLLGGAMNVPGGGDYREFLLPGMFAMTMVFGIGTTMVAVSSDAARGITDRFRSMPMSASAVVAGRALADMLNSAVALAVLILCGLAIGWEPGRGLGASAAAVGLLLLLRFAFLWIGVYLGLVFHADPEAVTGIRTLEFPIGFLANPFIPIATMPAWLGVIAAWNPLSSTTSAVRELFGNPTGDDGSWIAEHAMLMAVVWPLALIAVFLPLSIHRYRHLGK